MYLKSLQVVGFKSFADRTTLEFHRGVTAIVGPNGCGKSNVLDSIRWVLGEQSAKALRGGEMKDVIFSGTDTRPAVNMAEVSLTFAECEKELGTQFHEVTLTRRVFRDGASEYELNRTSCRLKDIQELFMDTGVGRTAYSIMEQGKIDMILSSRPEDRRVIFEEAAGITKYKSQKKEALKKLESTEANLLRLADVIKEVKRQVGSLQRQAAKAKRYQAAHEELVSLEMRIGRYHFNQYTSAIARLESVVGSARFKQEQMKSRVEEEEKKSEQVRGEIATIEAEFNRLREEEGALKHAVERAQQRVQSNRARVEEFTKLGDQAEQEITATAEKIVSGEGDLAQLTAQVEQSRAAQIETQKKYNLAQQQLNDLVRRLGSAKGEVARIEQGKLNLERQHQKQEQEAVGIKAQLAGFQERFAALKLDETGLLKRFEEMTGNLNQLVEKVRQEERVLAEKRTCVQQSQQRQRECEEAQRQSEKQLSEATRQLQTLQARRDALSQLQRQNIDAPQATQRLLKNRDESLLGTLAERLTVKAGYEKPIALLLADSFQALLVSNTEACSRWRQSLNKNEQCVFAPLELVGNSGNFATGKSVENGDSLAAHQYVSSDETASGLLAALLEDTYVVADLSAAWALRLQKPKATIVTEKGELISRSGLLSVGQDNGAALAVLTRQAEIRQLDIDIKKAGEAVALAQGNLEKSRAAVKEKLAEVEQFRTAAQALEITLAALRQEERTSRTSLEQLSRQKDHTGKEVARLSGQEREGLHRAETLRGAISESVQNLAKFAEQLAGAQALTTELSALEQQHNNAVVTVKMELSSQTHQCEAWQQQREPVARRLNELTELNKRRQRELQEHQQRIQAAQQEIAESAQLAENKSVILATVVNLLETNKAKRADAIQLITKLDAQLRVLRSEQSELHESRSGDEVALAEQRVLLTQLRERYQRDHQKELEDLPRLTEADQGVNWADLEHGAREKRTTLEAMGPVNLEAISEYDELEERQKFLTAQEADLVQSRDQLLKAIREINQTTQRLFADTFQQIRKNFQEMFVELFGGGKADLMMLDESDPLESGIDILAKPPGKQPQSISLLSGGEKTMTAVALLFSIYLVKPSPFCVLDEMDAPLDESNINRFIKILQRFVHQSQFVVITHNKRTISIADVLYGVTMEERGVSRFVSMRLSKSAPSSPSDSEPGATSGADREDGVPSLAEAVSGNS